ncbi:glycosyltransferase [Candidatus Nanohalovita haloferacivicina]|uniref:glycosyltransferase n=1 Tax=Candidatus Nanohalovita haloferacivicina TaxID=2978046 RepID=UPI00325FD339|nr:Glycosyl transferase family 2, poly-beta-1,6 N-acetyl-D-glucosamine synthase [Candidatus Nanohalobia archaeon BNXNv]
MLDPVMWMLYGIVLFITFFLLITLFDEGSIKPGVKDLEDLPTLSLIIPAFNEEETIAMTIDSALDINYPRDKYDIIVVNDGSTDSTLEEAKKFEDNENVTIIDKENGGKGSALNAGVEASDAEVVACVDADSILQEDSLKHMVAEKGDKYAGVASAMKVYEPENLLQKLQWVEYIVGIFTRNIMGIMNAIHVTPGPLSVYDREKIIEVGMFDEDSLVEDQEICFRLQDKHYKIGHASHAEVYTVAPSTWEGFKAQRYRWYRGSLETALQYKYMIFNREYGDLGMFAVPAKLAQTFLSLVVLFITAYMFGRPLVEFFLEFAQIGFYVFQFEPFTVSSLINDIYWNIISIRYTTFFFIAALFGTSITMAYMASQHTKENLMKHGLIPVIAYLAFFVFINGYLWLRVIISMILGAERKW